MAVHLHPDVIDLGLAEAQASGDKIVLCNAEPTNYTTANATYMIGYKNAPTIGAPEDSVSPAGRMIVVEPITDGVVDSDDTATWMALLDTATSRLLARQALSSPKALVTGDPWTSPEWKVIGKNPV